jgi:uncharacterized protein YbjT (DUF2867 family)
VNELLRRGHTVAALVRDPGKLGTLSDQIRVVVGDSTDPSAVAEALRRRGRVRPHTTSPVGVLASNQVGPCMLGAVTPT